MSARHPFDAAIALKAEADGSWHGRTSAAYANMIGPYGGITAAQCLQSVLRHADRLGDPIAFTVNFAAAIADGEFALRPRPVRTNRSTQHWFVEMLQGDHLVATATAVTATRRQTWAGLEARMPLVPRPDDTPRAQRRGVEWLNRYEMRFLEGPIPKAWDGETRDDSLSQLAAEILAAI